MSKTTEINPLADLSSVMPPNIKGEMFRQEIDHARWCCHTRSKGHSECDPWLALDGLLKRMVELGIGRNEMVPGLKGTPMTWAYYLYSKLYVLKCDGDEYRSYEPDLGSPEELEATLRKKLEELGISKKGVSQMVDLEIPELYWENYAMLYCVQNAGGTWQHECKEDATQRLVSAGVSNYSKGGDLSDADRVLLRVRNETVVDLMLPLAGYSTGLHTIKDQKILVPSSFRMINPIPDPKSRNFPHIWAIVSGLFGDQSVQVDHFMTKLKNDRASLLAGFKNGGLALLVAGDAGIGKTLLLSCIIIPALGGRSANVFAYLSGSTGFCKEQAGSEVWFIDDGNPFTTWEARRAFTNAIKQAVASAEVWVHGKGKDGKTLPLYRRLVVLTNIDSLDAMPEMEESLNDKIMLLKASKFEMPNGLMPLPPLYDVTKTAEFKAMLDRELPYFLDYVDNYDVPDYCKGSRFGVPYKNPELWESVKELSRDSEMHYLVQKAVYGSFSKGEGDKKHDGSYEYETNALISTLLDCRHTAPRAKAYTSTSKSFGSFLSHLKRTPLGKFYSTRRSGGKSYWTVSHDESLKHPKSIDEVGE